MKGMVSPLGNFDSSLFPPGLFSLAVCKEQATLAKPLTCISAPRAQKELKLWSHFFAVCCKFKATRDKAFCMRERVKREKTTCDLTCWFPETQLCRGQRGKEQKQEEGRKFLTKIPPSPSKKFLSQLLLEDITGILLRKKKKKIRKKEGLIS